MPRAKVSPEKNAVSTRVNRAKRVTLQDIAKVAGVHVMTVSDALNNTRSVAPSTREKIKKIAKELNYIPNFAARALVTGRTGIIAILSGALNEPYYANMVHLLEKHINANNYKLMLLRTPREVQDLVHATGDTSVDGAIAIDMYHLVDEFRTSQTVPLVSIGSFERSFVDHVVVDLQEGVAQALSMMLAAGRKRIAYIVTAPHLAEADEVRAGTYLASMAAAQRKPEIIDVNTDVFLTVRERFRAYIKANGCPDALLCLNDETAMCVYRVLRDEGFEIPDDVLLAGCDGQLHMEYFDPPLSTIRQPMEEMCATAWEFLMKRMAQPNLPIQQATLSGTLIVRQSLGYKTAPVSSKTIGL